MNSIDNLLYHLPCNCGPREKAGAGEKSCGIRVICRFNYQVSIHMFSCTSMFARKSNTEYTFVTNIIILSSHNFHRLSSRKMLEVARLEHQSLLDTEHINNDLSLCNESQNDARDLRAREKHGAVKRCPLLHGYPFPPCILRTRPGRASNKIV